MDVSKGRACTSNANTVPEAKYHEAKPLPRNSHTQGYEASTARHFWGRWLPLALKDNSERAIVPKEEREREREKNEPLEDRIERRDYCDDEGNTWSYVFLWWERDTDGTVGARKAHLRE